MFTFVPGQASGENAKAAGEMAKEFADISWSFAQKQELVDKKSNVPSIGPIAVNVGSLSPKAQMLHKEVHEFVREIILPIEQELRNHTESEDWKPSFKMEELKVLYFENNLNYLRYFTGPSEISWLVELVHSC